MAVFGITPLTVFGTSKPTNLQILIYSILWGANKNSGLSWAF